MKPKSAIEKGKRLEVFLEDFLKKNVDINTRINRGSGNGVNKGDIRIPSLDIVIEAKNQSKVFLIDDWEQAREQCLGNDRPILAIRNPRKGEFQEVLMVMDLGTFAELASGQGAPVQEELTWQDRRMIETLKRACGDVLNRFGT